MVTHDNRDDATRETQELWHTNYPSEPYCLDMMSFDTQEQNCEGSPSQFVKSKLQQKTKSVFRMPRVLNYDFVKAAGRQRSFYYQVSCKLTRCRYLKVLPGILQHLVLPVATEFARPFGL